jgi:hypothetical protein
LAIWTGLHCAKRQSTALPQSLAVIWVALREPKERSSANRQACLGAVTFEPRIASNLPANGRLMPIQKLGYLALGFSVFHKDVNLILFSLCSGVDRSWLL